MATARKGAKRANGEGTISYDAQRKRYDVRITIDGKRRKVSAPTQAEAWRRAKELKAAPGSQSMLPGRPTVAQWLDHWRTHVLPGTVKRTTEDSYAFVIDNCLKPEIGRHKLADLTPAHVREMLRHLERGTDTHRPLSANTRRIALAVLRRSLKVAEREELVSRNVAGLTDGVKLDRKRGRSLTPDQARQVITAIADSDELTEALLTLLIVTGMRKGEALGLRWSDIDAKAQTAHVRRTLSRTPSQNGSGTQYLAESTKTAGSDRVVELEGPAMGALKRWKKAQRAQRLACPAFPEGLDWGMGFPDDLVFTGPRGQALDLSRPNELLAEVTESLGLGRWTPHELRHTAASLMLGADVPLPTVSRVLGHSNIGVTMNVYGHLVSGEKKAAAKALTGVLFGDRSIATGSDS
jgi:integrase